MGKGELRKEVMEGEFEDEILDPEEQAYVMHVGVIGPTGELTHPQLLGAAREMFLYSAGGEWTPEEVGKVVWVPPAHPEDEWYGVGPIGDVFEEQRKKLKIVKAPEREAEWWYGTPEQEQVLRGLWEGRGMYTIRGEVLEEIASDIELEFYAGTFLEEVQGPGGLTKLVPRK